jgi:hypothetical protein
LRDHHSTFGPSFVFLLSNANSKKIFQRKSTGLKSQGSLKKRDDRVYHLTEFGLRIQGEKIVPAQENKI